MNANTVPRVRIPLSPPQIKNPPNRVGSLFLCENILGFEPEEYRASSLTAADGGKRENEKGENKEYRAYALACARDDYIFEWGNPSLHPLRLKNASGQSLIHTHYKKQYY